MTNQPTPVILSDDQVAEIEARANAATKAPWKQSALAGMYIVADKTDFATIASVGEYNADGSIHLAFADAEANLSFITHTREDIPALCQTVRALRAEREGLIADLNETRRLAFNRGQENTTLRQQLAQLQDQLQLAAYAAEEYKRQAIAAISGVEKERDDVLNRSHQTVLFNCGCMFKQEGLDAEPMLVVHCAGKEQP